VSERMHKYNTVEGQLCFVQLKGQALGSRVPLARR